MEKTIDKRKKMRSLCELAGSIPKAAEILARVTRRPVSVDTIKSWTCSEDTDRSRPVQDWAITILQEELADVKNPVVKIPVAVKKVAVKAAAKKSAGKRATAVKA